jgi:Ribbon-helix-helix protein, copG family.
MIRGNERVIGLMPNKRKDGKKRIAVWLTPDERKALDAMVERMGIDMSEFVKLAIANRMKETGNDCSKKDGSGNCS